MDILLGVLLGMLLVVVAVIIKYIVKNLQIRSLKKELEEKEILQDLLQYILDHDGLIQLITTLHFRPCTRRFPDMVLHGTPSLDEDGEDSCCSFSLLSNYLNRLECVTVALCKDLVSANSYELYVGEMIADIYANEILCDYIYRNGDTYPYLKKYLQERL